MPLLGFDAHQESRHAHTEPFCSSPITAAVLGATRRDRRAARAQAPPKADVPPPPGINDPGVTAARRRRRKPAAGHRRAGATPIRSRRCPSPTPASCATAPIAIPTRCIAAWPRASTPRAQEGDDTVDEYRQNGNVWMIHIVPRNGPVETFMDTTGNGRLTRDPQQGPVAPVYFSLYEWN